MEATLSRSDIDRILKETLSENELQKSVVYVIPSLEAGETITINRLQHTIDEPSWLLFIDLEPRVNWSHRCRYILVGKKNKDTTIIEGQFPPAGERLEIVHQSPNTEEWMLLSEKLFK